MQSIIRYNAAGYARASKDDADSSTIENQIELIRDFTKSKPEINLICVGEDNGFSGIDFLRPSFSALLKDIEAGRINCVIVKDLSRLGRNYIEVGELMDVIFPRFNVRLIAINDHYDSLNPRSSSDRILIPFRNIFNEQYLRETSKKVRLSLNDKRQNGKFVSPIAPYGYMRDENDKHRLVIDEHAAEVVRDIFRLKIEGMSQNRIAERLNSIGEPSPAEYKRRYSAYFTAFQKSAHAAWSAVTVGRILRNPMYIGTLVQGRRTTPNYKIKREVLKPEDEWNVIPDAHEAIIAVSDFEVVNGLLSQDSYTAPQKDTVYPLSGLVYCGDCGNSMVRKKARHYNYYVCATSKKGKDCTSHCYWQSKIDGAIFAAITRQIAYVMDIEQSLEYVRSLPSQQRSPTKLNAQIADREQEIQTCERHKRSLYEDYKDGVITYDDYKEYGRDYTERIKSLQQAVEWLRQEAELICGRESPSHKWIEYFKRYRNVAELSRELTANLIERIDVYEGNRIEIRFRFQERQEVANEVLNNFIGTEARYV